MNSTFQFSRDLHQCTDSEGHTFFTYPVRLEDPADLTRWQANRSQVRRLFPGQNFILVPVKEKAVSDFQWKSVNTEHSREYARNRCMVQGAYGRPVRCRDTNSCAACPYGRSEWERQPMFVSLERKRELHDFDPVDPRVDVCQLAVDRVALSELRSLMDRQDPRIMEAIELKARYYYSVKEIADKLGVSASMVYHLLGRAVAIGRAYRDED